MALIELATVIADDPGASRRWAAEPLPVTDRLNAVITARFAALPAPAQAALRRALGPAEPLGLVTVRRGGLRFSHPLGRPAISHSPPSAQRATAPRELAETL